MKNIVLFMADQFRADCLGCSGNDAIRTPYLDSLAAQGVNFTRCYTPSPSCIPARASLLTGMNQWHHGILGMGSGMPGIASNYKHTLPGELAAAGYHTQGVGKMHYAPQRALNGFHNVVLDESGRRENSAFISDYWLWYDEQTGDVDGYRDHSIDWNSWMSRPYHEKESLHPTHWTADEAIKFIRRRDPEKPFFLKCSFSRPHSPYDPPQVYYDMYKDEKLPSPHIGDWCGENEINGNPYDVNAWRGKIKDRDIHDARASYYGNVTFIDHSIGRVMYELDRNHGILKDTMIIFTSDHGDMLGDHHLWRKTYAYEGSARIPMIIRPPECKNPGAVCGGICSLTDIMPTLLDFAGVKVPQTCDGVSLLPLISDPSSKVRDFHIGEHCACYSSEQENYFVAGKGKKYIWFPNSGEEQFFDIDKDPGELCNLIKDEAYAGAAAELRGELVKEFAYRDCGLEKNGGLIKKSPQTVIHSPNLGVYGVM